MTIFQGVPTMYTAMLNSDTKDDFDVSSLRLCMSGGVGRCPARSSAASRSGSGARSSRATACPRPRRWLVQHPDRERKEGSIGPPIEGVEMRVVDEDRTTVERGRGRRDRHPRPQHHEGLLEPPEATAEVDHATAGSTPATWPTRDEEGLLLHRRPQEGHDHPRRLQRVPARDRGGPLRAPAVAECAVVGVPDDNIGEEVGAAVVLKSGDDASRGRAARLRQGAGRGATSTRARSGSRTSCPRARRARSSRRTSRCPRR